MEEGVRVEIIVGKEHLFFLSLLFSLNELIEVRKHCEIPLSRRRLPLVSQFLSLVMASIFKEREEN